MKKIRAQQIHGIVESLTFLSIFLTCFFLILRTSIRQESISKDGICTYKNKRGFIGVLYDDVHSDFETFTIGNGHFHRRLYEYFLRPRAPSSYVFSPTSIAIGLMIYWIFFCRLCIHVQWILFLNVHSSILGMYFLFPSQSIFLLPMQSKLS